VKLLGAALAKEQVQPDLEQLDTNMEENEEDGEEEEKKSVEKLGKLQIKLEYDFQKSEVSTTRCPTAISYYQPKKKVPLATPPCCCIPIYKRGTKASSQVKRHDKKYSCTNCDLCLSHIFLYCGC